jgi:hypothetical protein
LRFQWKDRSADGPVSAKKPKKVKDRQKKEREEGRRGSGAEEDGRGEEEQ